MSNLFKKTVRAGLIVGTLDILSAFIHYFIKTGQTHFFDVLKFVASGVFGSKASTGGDVMILAGLVLHYAIALVFTIVFFWFYPTIKVFSKNKILVGIVYGIFIWVIMNLVVVPLSNVANRPFHIENAIINAVILIVCVGLPLSFMADTFYENTDESPIS